MLFDMISNSQCRWVLPSGIAGDGVFRPHRVDMKTKIAFAVPA
jgi:hypothetical protein